MKTISPTLQTFLLTNTVFGRADLISIAIQNGVTINAVYGTNTDITYDSVTYYSSKYGSWERGPFTNQADYRPNANSMELSALFQPDGASFPSTTVSMMNAVAAGVFSGATVTVQTVYWPIGTDPNVSIVGGYTLNVGTIGNVQKTGRSKAVFEVFDMTYQLNRPMPPYNIQSQCRHTLGNHGCTILLSNWTSTAVTLDSTSTSIILVLDIPARQNTHGYSPGNMILVSGVPYMCRTGGTSAGSPPAFNSTRSTITNDGGGGLTWVSMDQAYQLGFVTFASGENVGFKSSVKLQSLTAGGLVQFQLFKPTYFDVSAGDTVTLTAGCDKSTATCSNAFANLIHYGGMPFVPNPEIAQ